MDQMLLKAAKDSLDHTPQSLPEAVGDIRIAMYRLLDALQSPPLPSTGETSERSSAHTTGPAPKQSASSMETLDVPTGRALEDLMSCLRVGISAFTNWHPSTLLRTKSLWLDGQTLRVTCTLRGDYGESKAGDPGAAVHDPLHDFDPEPARAGDEARGATCKCGAFNPDWTCPQHGVQSALTTDPSAVSSSRESKCGELFTIGGAGYFCNEPVGHIGVHMHHFPSPTKPAAGGLG